MKKLLLLSLSLMALTTFAQYDLSTRMVKPVDGQYIVAGDTWDVELVIKNNGLTAVSSADTLALFPSIAGNYVIGGIAEFVDIPVGDSATVTFTHPALTGPDGLVDFCVFAAMWQVEDTDSSDNIGCNEILWDSDPTVSTEEFSIIQLKDNSYYSNNVYFVELLNTEATNVKLSAYNLAGQEVFNANLEDANNNSIKQEVRMPELPNGVYLFSITSNEGNISTKKVIIQ